MKFLKLDLILLFIILIISLLFSLELFVFSGRPATFDTNVHISNIAQFSKILSTGEFPVIWMNNFANYGLPVGIFSHQLPNYIGGIINIFIQNPTLSYNLMVFTGIFLTNIFLFIFLRLNFKSWASFLGVFVFCFTPYHIFNIYIRGAMPEVFSGIFVPLILSALYLIVKKNKTYAYFLLSLFIFGLTLNHPMMLIVYSLILIPYLIYLLLSSNLKMHQKIRIFILSGSFMFLGLIMASYYIIPLNLEIKYFYYGLIKDHIDINSFISIFSLANPNWYFSTKNEVFTRGHVVIFGLLESFIIVFSAIWVILNKIILKNKNSSFLYFCLIEALIIILLNMKLSYPVFKYISILNNIQFPWRFLSDLIFIPPLIIAFLYNLYPKKIFILITIIFVAMLSFPQIYGKNFTIYSDKDYYFATENAHSVLMNTIWTGKSEDYPNKNPQIKIAEGKGKIFNTKILNSSRKFNLEASTPLKIIDHTFYFPGWNVYVDGNKTNIEFQNPEYRGVITYNVLEGKHSVYAAFEDTKVRFLGKIISIISIILFTVLFLTRKKVEKFLI